MVGIICVIVVLARRAKAARINLVDNDVDLRYVWDEAGREFVYGKRRRGEVWQLSGKC